MISHYLPFGKHRGRPLNDVPLDYLAWLIEQPWLHEKFPSLAEAVTRRLDGGSDDTPSTALSTRLVKTWRQRVLSKWHPDRAGGSHAAFVAVNDAVESLSAMMTEVSA